MINDLKLGFKIMKYGHSAKLSFNGSIAMAVFGVAFCAINLMVTNSFPGGYFLMMSVLLLMQLISTVNAANLVQTSPAKKKLQTSVPALFSVLLMLIAYLLNVIISVVAVCLNPETMEYICTQMIYIAAVMGGVMLYYGAVFKYFVASTTLFLLLFLGTYSAVIMDGELHWNFMPFAGHWGNVALTAVIGLAVILVCGVLEYLISLAVYKAPISKWALGARLRSQL